ncbi:hypothetical protein [Geodermatophilus poikilotrophus]|uniref:Uncharacterized protein n=1 Tax=Geodermatophilus poikilotrophus TaxID=1333667 RepID=A0A1I0HUA9_9ACTN|nr:hypothetical protein [Geodermatophilus poikilotrophus]SET87624.1 hypothetical protein SAMN04488546_4027 [Geodermatophilus poikilotrophus]
MTVTDPDVPDPLNDPRTLQADPGAYGQGGDLASTEDDAVSTGADELAADDLTGDDPTDDDLTAGRNAADDAGGGDVTGGAFSESPRG